MISKRIVIRRSLSGNEHDLWIDGLYIGIYKTHAVALAVASNKLKTKEREERWQS